MGVGGSVSDFIGDEQIKELGAGGGRAPGPMIVSICLVCSDVSNGARVWCIDSVGCL